MYENSSNKKHPAPFKSLESVIVGFMISEDTVQQLYSGSFSVKITDILHVYRFIPKHNHTLFETCNADKPVMNV